MAKQSWAGENRMKVRTYGVWPIGTWQQTAPQRIAAVRVTPSYEQPHPSGAPACEVEIVYEMAEPQEPGGRHSLILDAEQAHRLTAMLMAAWQSSGGSEPSLPANEQITIGETVRIEPPR
jgi:hypothetical protein